MFRMKLRRVWWWLWSEKGSAESERVGDRIVALAREHGTAAPEGASLDGPPFRHDPAKAPLMIDVDG